MIFFCRLVWKALPEPKNMSYQVLARKWRPQTFAEVVGQEHIARTLKNALLSNRIGHAYLFVGSRGIGKTTSARIFAKALNCEHPVDGEPCCQCDSCKEIAAGSSLDVIEIDGASHNTVDDMRTIRDQVLYPPVKSKYKVYIIDEVHMLSASAWNALLKTLEEPPAYVKFLFATTEPHKVLPTIISRCQRFDLRRIPVPLIMSRLRQIADAEKLFVEDAALAGIARAADGGMRDAQSIFDQMIAFCGGNSESETIREQDVINIFGLASGAELREMAVGVIQNDLPRVLDVIAALANAGRDLERVYADFVEYFRNLMLAGTCQDASKFLEVSHEELAELTQLSRAAQPALIRRILTGLVAQERLFNDCLNKRIALEVVIAQIMTDVHSTDLDDILTHLNVISGLIPKDEITARKPANLVQPPVAKQPTPIAQQPAPQPVVQQPATAPQPQPIVQQPATAPQPQQVVQQPAPVVQPQQPAPQEPVKEVQPAIQAPAQQPSSQTSKEEEIRRLLTLDTPVSDDAPIPEYIPESSYVSEIETACGTAAPATTELPPMPEIPMGQEPPASSQPEPPASGYRRATKPELAELKKTSAAQVVTQALGVEPYDARIPL